MSELLIQVLREIDLLEKRIEKLEQLSQLLEKRDGLRNIAKYNKTERRAGFDR
uniref:Uncharacterized protein n=1 Tax=viral metagenome TaxID=1070528 RepID=A0A6M3JSP8_9ZZZZ